MTDGQLPLVGVELGDCFDSCGAVPVVVRVYWYITDLKLNTIYTICIMHSILNVLPQRLKNYRERERERSLKFCYEWIHSQCYHKKVFLLHFIEQNKIIYISKTLRWENTFCVFIIILH